MRFSLKGLSPARALRLIVSSYLNRLRNARYRLFGVTIGERTVISSGAWLDCYRGKLIIGSGCRVTHGAKILSHDQTLSRIYGVDANLGIAGRTVLEDNVFIGMNAVVLPNVTIGKGSIIGAGTVVTADVPPGVVMAGNPMRMVKRYDPGQEVWVSVKQNPSEV